MGTSGPATKHMSRESVLLVTFHYMSVNDVRSLRSIRVFPTYTLRYETRSLTIVPFNTTYGSIHQPILT